jgi:hypothetical protein
MTLNTLPQRSSQPSFQHALIMPRQSLISVRSSWPGRLGISSASLGSPHLITVMATIHRPRPSAREGKPSADDQAIN